VTDTLPLWRLRLGLAGDWITAYVYAWTVDEAFRIPTCSGSPYADWYVRKVERSKHLRPPHPDDQLRVMGADWCVLVGTDG
jgi:hypothetical protein